MAVPVNTEAATATDNETVAGRRKDLPTEDLSTLRGVDRLRGDQAGCEAAFVFVSLLYNARKTPVIATGGRRTSRMSLPDSALALLPFPRPVA